MIYSLLRNKCAIKNHSLTVNYEASWMFHVSNSCKSLPGSIKCTNQVRNTLLFIDDTYDDQFNIVSEAVHTCNNTRGRLQPC